MKVIEFYIFIHLCLFLQSSKLKIQKTETQNKNCGPLCSECSSFTSCSFCVGGAILYELNCYMKCPEGTFLDGISRSCRVCHPTCPICWGPSSEMCGMTNGISTPVVFLENEIKSFFGSHTFSKNEIDIWLQNLKIILSRTKDDLAPDKDFEKLSTNEVYLPGANNNYELPIGSFSKYNGVFVPIPSYIGVDRKIVPSHWIFKRGMWDGKKWVGFYQRLPSFIQIKGDKNKIYKENKGFWVWDKMNEWTFHQRGISDNLYEGSDINITETIRHLNEIKMDVIYLIN